MTIQQMSQKINVSQSDIFNVLEIRATELTTASNRQKYPYYKLSENEMLKVLKHFWRSFGNRKALMLKRLILIK